MPRNPEKETARLISTEQANHVRALIDAETKK